MKNNKKDNTQYGITKENTGRFMHPIKYDCSKLEPKVNTNKGVETKGYLQKDNVLFQPWPPNMKELPHCDYCDDDNYKPKENEFIGFNRPRRKPDCIKCN